MDALEFLKERRRMCQSYTTCNECPLKGIRCLPDSNMSDEDYERVTATVEKWSAKHPRKTRQSVFLEQYPEAKMGADGVLKVCPSLVSASHRTSQGNCACIKLQCLDCRSEFWGQEVEY